MGLDWNLIAGFTKRAAAGAITSSLKRLAEDTDVLDRVAGYMSGEEQNKTWSSLPVEEKRRWRIRAANALRGLRLYLRKE